MKPEQSVVAAPSSEAIRSSLSPQLRFTTLLEQLAAERPRLPLFAQEGSDPLAQAFSAKTTVHAGLTPAMYPADQRQNRFAELLARPRQGPTAAYFHIPFCQTRCAYCGFFNRYYQQGDSRRYVEALISEIEATATDPAVAANPVHAVYLGGGTPTALEPVDLLYLLQAIKSNLPLANDCEITLEGRVHGLGEELLAAATAGGVNRYSIGVQSFDTEVRRAMGRIAATAEIVALLEKLAATGQAAVIIDLVYGFPGQDLSIWERDLHTLRDLPLDGADLYQLNLLPNTTLVKLIDQGKLSPAASLPEQSRMFAMGVEMMESARWQRLSISHWRRGMRERNLYNRLVKSGAHILAYGCGAGGQLHGCRSFSSRDYDEYLIRTERGEKPLAMLAAPSPVAALGHLIGDGFDRGVLNLDEASTVAGFDVEPLFAPLINQWRECGLVRLEEQWLVLTRAGEFWQVNLAQALLAFCEFYLGKGKAVDHQ